jgi:MFS family permease
MTSLSASPQTSSLYTPRAKNFALLLLAMTQFVIVIDASIVNVALPSIGSALHFSRTDLSWVVNAYTLTFGGFLLLGGRLADVLGRRRMFMLGLALFSLASFAGGVAQSEGWLIAARAVQGLGAAIVSPAALSIITTTFAEGAERNRALGIWGASRAPAAQPGCSWAESSRAVSAGAGCCSSTSRLGSRPPRSLRGHSSKAARRTERARLTYPAL